MTAGATDSDPRQTGALWDWAVAAYGRPGAKGALLRLQEGAGVDVVLTLWRAWLWETGRAVSPEAEAGAIALSDAWRQAVVAPLRAARNALVERLVHDGLVTGPIVEPGEECVHAFAIL